MLKRVLGNAFISSSCITSLSFQSMPLPPDVLAKRQARYLVSSATSHHQPTGNSNAGPTVDAARPPSREGESDMRVEYRETIDATVSLAHDDIEARAEDWACAACTFINRQGTLACDVCQTQCSLEDNSGRSSENTPLAVPPSKRPRPNRDRLPEASHGPDAFLRALASAGGRALSKTSSSSASVPTTSSRPGSAASMIMPTSKLSAPLPLAYQPAVVPQRAPAGGPSALRVLSWNVDGLCDDGTSIIVPRACAFASIANCCRTEMLPTRHCTVQFD